MLERPDGERLLLAPTRETAGFVSGTYVFDTVRVVPVAVRVAGDTWSVSAGPLDLRFTTGRRRALGAHSAPVGLLLFPPLAALLDVGGLWLLYRTGLFAATAHRPLLHGLVQAHMAAAGVLFTFAVCGLDPVRHRWGLAVRGTTLLAAGAAHGALARTRYAGPPPGAGFTPEDLRQGAQWMYYGGDLVEAGLAVLMGTAWYAAAGRTRARRRRRGSAAGEAMDRPGGGTRRPAQDAAAGGAP